MSSEPNRSLSAMEVEPGTTALSFVAIRQIHWSHYGKLSIEERIHLASRTNLDTFWVDMPRASADGYQWERGDCPNVLKGFLRGVLALQDDPEVWAAWWATNPSDATRFGLLQFYHAMRNDTQSPPLFIGAMSPDTLRALCDWCVAQPPARQRALLHILLPVLHTLAAWADPAVQCRTLLALLRVAEDATDVQRVQALLTRGLWRTPGHVDPQDVAPFLQSPVSAMRAWAVTTLLPHCATDGAPIAPFLGEPRRQTGADITSAPTPAAVQAPDRPTRILARGP